jgi:hypothetical protein
MSTLPTERQQIIEAINTLSEESLSELRMFIEYLQYRSLQKVIDEPKTNFLLSIAGLGDSGEANVSERDEEILRTEIDPVYGWNLKSGNPE